MRYDDSGHAYSSFSVVFWYVDIVLPVITHGPTEVVAY